jgi:hypothetical protein
MKNKEIKVVIDGEWRDLSFTLNWIVEEIYKLKQKLLGGEDEKQD